MACFCNQVWKEVMLMSQWRENHQSSTAQFSWGLLSHINSFMALPDENGWSIKCCIQNERHSSLLREVGLVIFIQIFIRMSFLNILIYLLGLDLISYNLYCLKDKHCCVVFGLFCVWSAATCECGSEPMWLFIFILWQTANLFIG